MSQMRIALMVNPAAARGKRARFGRITRSLLHEAGHTIVDITGENARATIESGKALLGPVDALVAVGGDGTVSAAASIVAHTDTPLGIVPGGTGNDFARAAGLPINDPSAAVNIILDALTREPRRIDTIEVTHTNRDGETLRSNILGNISLGFDSLVNARANASSYGYILATVRELVRYRPRNYWIETDGGARFSVRASLVTLCNSGVFGGGMQYSPSSRIDDGVLELVRVSDVGLPKLVSVFPRVFRGTHTAISGFHVTPCTELRIGIEGDEKFPAYGDGELLGDLPLHATLAPRSLSLLAPPGFEGV